MGLTKEMYNKYLSCLNDLKDIEFEWHDIENKHITTLSDSWEKKSVILAAPMIELLNTPVDEDSAVAHLELVGASMNGIIEYKKSEKEGWIRTKISFLPQL